MKCECFNCYWSKIWCPLNHLNHNSMVSIMGRYYYAIMTIIFGSFVEHCSGLTKYMSLYGNILIWTQNYY